jgi:hypothetical protein
MIARKHLVGTATAVLATASLAAGVGLAVGSDSSPTPGTIHVDRQVTDQDVHPGTAAVLSAFSAFVHPSADAVATKAEQAVLRNALGADAETDYGAIGQADFSQARRSARGSSRPATRCASSSRIPATGSRRPARRWPRSRRAAAC